MAEGLNLMFRYHFVVWHLIPIHTSKNLRIFRMGYVTAYMVHAVVPQCIRRCTPTLPVIGKYRALFPYGKISPVSQARQRRPPAIW